MKKSLLVLSMFAATSALAIPPSLMIEGIFEASNQNGADQPKFVEIYVDAINDGDLTQCGIELVTNGTGSTGTQGFTFPPGSTVVAGHQHLIIANNATRFSNYMGYAADFVYTSLNTKSSGDDAVLVYCGGAVVDQYGDPDVDGSGQNWEYNDAFASRNSLVRSSNRALGNFVVGQWSIEATNSLDGCTTNGVGCGVTYGASTLPVELTTFSVE